MRRREALILPGLAVLLSACGDGDDMTQFPLKPNGLPSWHLWGSSQIIEVRSNGFTAGTATQQMARIQYKRPETWSFFFGGRLLGGPVSGVPPTQVQVDFQVMTGVGRSLFDTRRGPQTFLRQGFSRFLWQVPAGMVPGAQPDNLKFTSRTTSPPLDDGVGATSAQPIDWIVAQDIQCNADVAVISQAGANPVSIELWAFFAPRVHVRPDWFAEQFESGELNGK